MAESSPQMGRKHCGKNLELDENGRNFSTNG